MTEWNGATTSVTKVKGGRVDGRKAGKWKKLIWNQRDGLPAASVYSTYRRTHSSVDIFLRQLRQRSGYPGFAPHFCHESGGSHLIILNVCNTLLIHADIIQSKSYTSGLHAREIEWTTGAGAACDFLRRHGTEERTRKSGQRSNQGLGHTL